MELPDALHEEEEQLKRALSEKDLVSFQWEYTQRTAVPLSVACERYSPICPFLAIPEDSF